MYYKVKTSQQADDWYAQMKDYCDPKKYPCTHFNGWAMGGQNMCDVHLALKRLVALRFDGLLEKGVHDVMHSWVQVNWNGQCY